jgi:hypothetical protein
VSASARERDDQDRAAGEREGVAGSGAQAHTGAAHRCFDVRFCPSAQTPSGRPNQRGRISRCSAQASGGAATAKSDLLLRRSVSASVSVFEQRPRPGATDSMADLQRLFTRGRCLASPECNYQHHLPAMLPALLRCDPDLGCKPSPPQQSADSAPRRGLPGVRGCRGKL